MTSCDILCGELQGMLDQQQMVRRGESAVDQEREREMQQVGRKTKMPHMGCTVQYTRVHYVIG